MLWDARCPLCILSIACPWFVRAVGIGQLGHRVLASCVSNATAASTRCSLDHRPWRIISMVNDGIAKHHARCRNHRYEQCWFWTTAIWTTIVRCFLYINLMTALAPWVNEMFSGKHRRLPSLLKRRLAVLQWSRSSHSSCKMPGEEQAAASIGCSLNHMSCHQKHRTPVLAYCNNTYI